MSKKRGLLKGLFYIIILAVLFFLLLKLSRAEIITDIVNITMTINSTHIVLNISGSDYTIINAPSAVNIQQNFTLFYLSNFTNTTIILNQTILSNITCTNNSISVSCSCPSCPSLPALINSSCSEVGFNNDTKTEFYNHYITGIGTRIEESSNKVAADVLFRLQPSTAQLDECKGNAYNASLKQLDAERQRDTALSAYDVKTVEFNLTKQELHTLQIVFIGFGLAVLIGILFGGGFLSKLGNMGV